MSSLAYRQNIVVTVPGNTRFYLVLNRNEKGREGIESAPTARPAPAATPSVPSVENASMETRYMQELESLKRQLEQISKQQSASDPGVQPEPPVPPPQQ
jgi:hypothetical protein